MITPKLVCCNFIDDVRQLRAFALDHGFAGVDWTFSQPEVFRQPAAEADIIRAIQSLHPLEVRFHCAFAQTDLGDEDPMQADAALRTFQAVCRLVSKLKGRDVTIHIGLGRESTTDLCWERTLAGLSNLVQFATSHGSACAWKIWPGAGPAARNSMKNCCANPGPGRLWISAMLRCVLPWPVNNTGWRILSGRNPSAFTMPTYMTPRTASGHIPSAALGRYS